MKEMIKWRKAVTTEKIIPWTTIKQIFKEMCDYVKARDPEDYVP